VGILLEGTFPSFFRNYPVPNGVHPGDAEVIPSSRPTSIFVATDGEMVANEVQFEGGRLTAKPLGYDRYTRQTFGNREFIMNLISYMTDDTGLIELRSREFKLRLLDRERIGSRTGRRTWTLVNTLVPVALVVVAGLLFQLLRRRRYIR
jgi:ABC-2 type transport system permease protein